MEAFLRVMKEVTVAALAVTGLLTDFYTPDRAASESPTPPCTTYLASDANGEWALEGETRDEEEGFAGDARVACETGIG
jgi:hypothetical protein